MSKSVAVVLAAGQGKRMNSTVQKQYLLIQNKPVLYYSLKAFEDSFIDEIILVVGSGEKEYCQTEIVNQYGFSKVTHIVEGGKERYHSVFHGLQAAQECFVGDGKEYVFIHDGARPFVTLEILERAYQNVKEYGACVVGMPVKDTIKIANADKFVETTPKRDDVWLVQTPQVFSYALVYKAYQKLMEEENNLLAQGIFITDDTMVVEYFTQNTIKLVQGSYENIKITTPIDMILAEAILKGRHTE